MMKNSPITPQRMQPADKVVSHTEQQNKKGHVFKSKNSPIKRPEGDFEGPNEFNSKILTQGKMTEHNGTKQSEPDLNLIVKNAKQSEFKDRPYSQGNAQSFIRPVVNHTHIGVQ